MPTWNEIQEGVRVFFKKAKKASSQDEKDKKPTYWERVIHGKGTVAEPWPTAEELWNDPKVQKAIQNHNELIRRKDRS